MKKTVLALLCIAVFVAGYAQSSANKNGNESLTASLNGAWQVVSVNVNGKDSSTGKPIEYWVLSDGFFSNVGLDSNGHWTDTHGGTYEIDGNIYKEKLVYSSHPERIGVTHWIEMRRTGDTLHMKYFNKLIGPDGQDVTAQITDKMEVTLVRVKKQ